MKETAVDLLIHLLGGHNPHKCTHLTLNFIYLFGKYSLEKSRRAAQLNQLIHIYICLVRFQCLWWRHCANASVRFRHKKTLGSSQKNITFCLKIPVLVTTNMAGVTTLKKNIQQFHAYKCRIADSKWLSSHWLGSFFPLMLNYQKKQNERHFRRNNKGGEGQTWFYVHRTDKQQY